MTDIAAHGTLGVIRDIGAGSKTGESLLFQFIIDFLHIIVVNRLPMEVGQNHFPQLFAFFGVNNVSVERPDLRVLDRIIEFFFQPGIVRPDNS